MGGKEQEVAVDLLNFKTACQTEKATLLSQRGLYLSRRRPTLPHTCGAGAPARETCLSARQHPPEGICIPMFTCHRQRSVGQLRCGLKAAGGGRPTQSVLHVYQPDSREVPVPQTAPAFAEGGRCFICHLLHRRPNDPAGAGPRSGSCTLFERNWDFAPGGRGRPPHTCSADTSACSRGHA